MRYEILPSTSQDLIEKYILDEQVEILNEYEEFIALNTSSDLDILDVTKRYDKLKRGIRSLGAEFIKRYSTENASEVTKQSYLQLTNIFYRYVDTYVEIYMQEYQKRSLERMSKLEGATKKQS